ncbi:MAG: hypothetical protein KDD13_00235 [Mangrovimonas sp.]|nr:hypothetical protein [Mangrovimonas sp.]
MSRLIFNILILTSIGCGVQPKFELPTHPKFPKDNYAVVLAKQTAENAVGSEIDLNNVNIWAAQQFKIEECGSQGNGCYNDGNILVRSDLSPEEFCRELSYLLVEHAQYYGIGGDQPLFEDACGQLQGKEKYVW